MALVAVFATGVSACAGEEAAQQPGVSPPGPAVSVPAALRDFHAPRSVAPPAKPVWLRIPVLDVHSRLERLGRRPNATVAVPKDWQRAGWYRHGARPGELGSAVILGHVDSPDGAAIFAGLAGLDPGARIVVGRADGTRVIFRVRRIETYDRSRFPTEAVYLPTLTPQLRLITCGGRYDRARGRYQANVVVFADGSLAGRARRP
jgi:hypothetical protein